MSNKSKSVKSKLATGGSLSDKAKSFWVKSKKLAKSTVKKATPHVKSALEKTKEASKKAYEKTKDVTKNTYDKAKKTIKEKLHDEKKKIALQVIDETKDKVSGKEAEALGNALPIVSREYAGGGKTAGKPNKDAVAKKLYRKALDLFNAHVNMGGDLEYSEKDYSYLSDDLDSVAVGYLKETPDGDEQQRLADENFKMTADEVINTLTHRIDTINESIGVKMATGGGVGVGEDRMYYFLKDDLGKLEKAIKEGDKEEVDRFFSYWGYHLKSLENKGHSKDYDRMYNFMKDDLKKLEKAIEANDKEEIDRFFSYWSIHLKSLKYSSGGSMATGGGVEKDFNDWYRYGTSSQKDFFWLINDKFKEGDIRYARKLFSKLSLEQKKSFTEIEAFKDAIKVLSERMSHGVKTGLVVTKDGVAVDIKSDANKTHIFYDKDGNEFKCLGYHEESNDCLFLDMKSGKEYHDCVKGYYYNNPEEMRKGGQLKMLKDKYYYMELPAYKGFKWRGFWDGYHHFVAKEDKGFTEVRATDQDIDDGNLKDMIDLGVTKEHGGYMAKGGRIITFEDGFKFKVVSYDYAKNNWDKEQIYKIFEDEQSESLVDDGRRLTSDATYAVEIGFKKATGGYMETGGLAFPFNWKLKDGEVILKHGKYTITIYKEATSSLVKRYGIRVTPAPGTGKMYPFAVGSFHSIQDAKYATESWILLTEKGNFSKEYLAHSKRGSMATGGHIDDLTLREVQIENELRGYRQEIRDAKTEKEKHHMKLIIEDAEEELMDVRNAISNHYEIRNTHVGSMEAGGEIKRQIEETKERLRYSKEFHPQKVSVYEERLKELQRELEKIDSMATRGEILFKKPNIKMSDDLFQDLANSIMKLVNHIGYEKVKKAYEEKPTLTIWDAYHNVSFQKNNDDTHPSFKTDPNRRILSYDKNFREGMNQLNDTHIESALKSIFKQIFEKDKKETGGELEGAYDLRLKLGGGSLNDKISEAIRNLFNRKQGTLDKEVMDKTISGLSKHIPAYKKVWREYMKTFEIQDDGVHYVNQFSMAHGGKTGDDMKILNLETELPYLARESKNYDEFKDNWTSEYEKYQRLADDTFYKHQGNAKDIVRAMNNSNNKTFYDYHTSGDKMASGGMITGEKLNSFYRYVDSFYGKDGIYGKEYFAPNGVSMKEIKDATEELSKDSRHMWGGGDSYDREKVRDIMLKHRGTFAKGGEIYVMDIKDYGKAEDWDYKKARKVKYSQLDVTHQTPTDNSWWQGEKRVVVDPALNIDGWKEVPSGFHRYAVINADDVIIRTVVAKDQKSASEKVHVLFPDTHYFVKVEKLMAAGGGIGSWFRRNKKESSPKEYEVSIVRKDGTTDNPIFPSLSSAENHKRDMESLGYKATVKPLMAKGGGIDADVSFFDVQFALSHLVNDDELKESQMDSILNKINDNRIKIADLKDIQGVTPDILEKIIETSRSGEYKKKSSREEN